jgi:hypothetical protein
MQLLTIIFLTAPDHSQTTKQTGDATNKKIIANESGFNFYL